MRYREYKQKVPKHVKGDKPKSTQEFSTSKIYKYGELPPVKGKNKGTKKRFNLSKLKLNTATFKALLNFASKKIVTAAKKIKYIYQISSLKQKIISVVVAIFLIITFGMIITKFSGSDKSSPQVKGVTTKIIVNCPGGDEKPKFGLLFPAGKDANSLGGICRTSPKTSAPVFTYRDNIDGVKIKVNQQVVPSGMAKQEDLATFAKQNYYNEMFMVDDTKVYAGQSARGEQFLVLVKNNLLIFVTADKKIDTKKWVEYISLLI